jgi:indolepyruvate ferredoxin oxidoreductase
MLKDESAPARPLAEMSLEEIIAHRAAHLTAYQNAGLAARYRALVDKVAEAVQRLGVDPAIVRSVAINYAKLLAYKDEYEVARLFTDGRFEREVREHFEGDFRLSYNLAPPLLPAQDDGIGRPKKRVFGPWMRTGFRLLAGLRGLRGTAFDVFGYSHDRKLERALIEEYESDVKLVLERLSPAAETTALALLSLPDEIRGYGPVKEAAYRKTRARRDGLLRELVSPPPVVHQVAAE